MRRLGDEDGSILPLIFGFFAIALAVVLIVTAATSLYLERSRLYTLADGAALAGADSFALDTTWGTGGVVNYTWTPGQNSSLYRIKVRPDGTIVALGQTYDGVGYRAKVVSLTAAGAPTPGFGTAGVVTISIGLATLDTVDDNAATILKRADQALYRAKRDGRNRVVADAA